MTEGPFDLHNTHAMLSKAKWRARKPGDAHIDDPRAAQLPSAALLAAAPSAGSARGAPMIPSLQSPVVSGSKRENVPGRGPRPNQPPGAALANADSDSSLSSSSHGPRRHRRSASLTITMSELERPGAPEPGEPAVHRSLDGLWGAATDDTIAIHEELDAERATGPTTAAHAIHAPHPPPPSARARGRHLRSSSLDWQQMVEATAAAPERPAPDGLMVPHPPRPTSASSSASGSGSGNGTRPSSAGLRPNSSGDPRPSSGCGTRPPSSSGGLRPSRPASGSGLRPGSNGGAPPASGSGSRLDSSSGSTGDASAAVGAVGGGGLARPLSASGLRSASRPSSSSGRREGGLWPEQPSPSARESPLVRRASQINARSPRPNKSTSSPANSCSGGPLASASFLGLSSAVGSPARRVDDLTIEDADDDDLDDLDDDGSLEDHDDSDDSEPLPDPFDIDCAACPDIYPLTMIQQAQLHSSDQWPNVVQAIRYAGHLDVSSLNKHLQALVAHHEVLRTKIEGAVGRALGRVCLPEDVPPATARVEDGDEETALPQLVERELTTPLATATQQCSLPLLREKASTHRIAASVLRLRKDVCVVVLAVPRFACDHWSAMLLARQLVALLTGADPQLPRPPFVFSQLALHEARLLSGGHALLARLRQYWGRQLLQHPILRLPLTQAGAPGLPHQRTRFRISRTNIVAFSELLVLPSESHVDADDTALLLCLCAWLVALQQLTGVADFVVGLQVSVRDLHPTGAAGLVAPLSSVLPLQVQMSRAHHFVDLYTSVGRRLEQARLHAQCPAGAPDCLNIPCFPIQFEYLRQADVAQLSSANYPGELLFSDVLDVLPQTRALPTPVPEQCALLVRMWESPESSRRVWGELVYRGDALPQPAVTAMLETVRLVAREAACEAYVTLAKLTSRIANRAGRPGSRPGSARAPHGDH